MAEKTNDEKVMSEKQQEEQRKVNVAAVTEVVTDPASDVHVAEKDVRGLLHEVSDRIKSMQTNPEKLKAMVAEILDKKAKEDHESRSAVARKGGFSGVDAEDPGARMHGRLKGKLSNQFTFKHAITGMVPRRWVKRFGEELRELHDMNDELLIVSKVLQKNPKELKMWQEYSEMAEDFAAKALVSTVSGSGDEFVPTNFSAQLIEKQRLALKVAALHDRIPMTSNPFTVPLEGSDATAVLATEATVDATEAGRITSSTPGTSSVTFTAKKLAVRTIFSEEINEASIINIIDFVRQKIATALANGVETATINGDDSATHQDGDVTSATDARKAWDGYRKITRANGKIDAGGNALAAADIRNARKTLDKFGINPAELAIVAGVNGFHQMLAESDSNGFNDFRTLDKLGAKATILTGQLGAFDGMPVIVSEYIREDVGASGVYDGTNVGRTTLHVVNKTRFWYGDRRSITLKTFEDIQTDQMVMVVKQRLDFEPTEDTTNNDLVATVIDILVN